MNVSSAKLHKRGTVQSRGGIGQSVAKSSICPPQVKKYYKGKEELVSRSIFQYTVMQ